MRNLSDEFIEQQNKGNHNYQKFVDITLKDGTVLHLTNKHLWNNGFSFEDSVSSTDNFDIGSAITNKFKIVLNNISDEFTKYLFAGATAVVFVGLQLSTGVEKIRICTGVISEEPKQRSSIITLQFLDNMCKFDRDYSEVKTVYPATRNQIVRDICAKCGVQLQTITFSDDNYIIQKRPNDEALTCRQMLAWVAQIGCQWAKCDSYGRLCISWYKDILFGEMEVDAAGALRVYEQILDGPRTEVNVAKNQYDAAYTEKGIFNVESGSLVYLAGDKANRPVNVRKMTDFVVDLEDVVITGVSVTEYKENITSENPAQTFLHGTKGYVLNISGNKLITEGTGQVIASMIGSKCVGMKFKPFTASCLTDIAIEAGDSVIITDRKGNVFHSFITNVSLQPGNFESISCGAKSAERNSAKQYSIVTQVEAEMRQEMQQEKTQREQALQALSDRISQASGGFTTVEIDTNGGKIFYLHNKPTLKDSDFIWKMTAEAWAVSTDGGQTWNAGMTVDGDTIVRILTATGVNADWINTGAITVKDNTGNIIFLVDMNTKRVIISGDSIQIGGKTATQALEENLTNAKNYSDGKLAEYAGTINTNIENLQKQVDGQVEDWYYDYEPTLQNIPASKWTTDAEKQKHIGDRFFWKTKGYAYRFMKDGNVWKWVLLKDTDITKAMQDAKNAKDVADGKRRTFITQPVPPYDIGDLWTDGTDVLTCVVSKATGTPYAISDWKKLNKYTDDTVANQALEEARKAQNLTISLSNDFQGIPAESNGNVIRFPEVKTCATVFYGHKDVSTECSYTVTKSASVTGNWDNVNRRYTITALSADSGYVDITASYLGLLTATKRFNVTKVKKGEEGSGLITSIATSRVIKRKDGNVFDPANISLAIVKYGRNFSIIEFDYEAHAIYTDGTRKLLETGTANNSTDGYTFAFAKQLQSDLVNIKAIEITVKSVDYNYYDSVVFDILNDVKPLNHTDVFNLLTNNGQFKGIYKQGNELYVNATYLATGIISDTYQENFWDLDTGDFCLTSRSTMVNDMPLDEFTQYEASRIEMGGVNLLQRYVVCYGGSRKISDTEIEIDGSASDVFFHVQPHHDLKSGQKYTLSFDAKGVPVGCKWEFYINGTASPWRFKIDRNGRISTTGILNSDILANRALTIDDVPGTKVNAKIRLSNFRLDRGVKAFDYAPAPEDIEQGITDLDKKLADPQEVFNRLTNNGKIQGLVMQNGDLYINATYIKSGVLTLGGANNTNGSMRVLDASGQTIGEWNKDGINIKKGNIYCKTGETGVSIYNGKMYLTHGNTDIGSIGTNYYIRNTPQKGIVFDLDNAGSYMTWAAMLRPTDDMYTMVWTYAKDSVGHYEANALHAGCDIDMHNHTLRNVKWPTTGITQQINYVQILEIDSNGNPTRWGPNGMMRFENGILVGLTYY